MSKNKDNKVKYNIKNAHYAVQKEDEEGTISFETPVPIKGAVSVSFDANGDITPFYADGIQYYVSAANNGYEGDAEFALIPDQFREDILKEQRDEKACCMRFPTLEIHRNLHSCSNLTETRKRPEECSITAPQQDRQSNQRQKKRMLNREQRQLRSATVRWQMAA